jgi:hypothetical protein
MVSVKSPDTRKKDNTSIIGKEGGWRLYYAGRRSGRTRKTRWGNKDGVCQYFNKAGALIREEGWRAMNPEKA